ncbi:MAG TPA: copper chaperone PCu(A)C [Rhodospirillales bacterium]|nr:copper chaperone PCu(A)C [Rhodospirillales bacterium]
MRFAKVALAAGLACAAALGSAVAADYTVGDITIKEPWARVTVGAGAGAAFLTIDNAGSKPDRLVSASSQVAKTTELHTHIRDGEVMRMRRIDAIEVPAKATTTLQPGGLHIMFMDLSAPLAAGGSFPLTLTFAEAGDVNVTVTVKDVAAMGQGSGGHGAMGGHGKPAESGY